jgi:beta-glucosidase
MRDLGVHHYRFSIAWPRVFPTGRGALNRAGLDFYSRLVDLLLDNDIEPTVTLYHWDLPQALEDRGGWAVRDTAQHFADYSSTVVESLGDRVHEWITLNEPWCSAMLGYATGRHAPGREEGEGALAAAHHLLLGHGLAATAMRAADTHAQVGITLNLQPVTAASGRVEDVAAAERSLMNANLLFTDPVLAGRYPDLARAVYQDITDFGFIQPDDLRTTAVPLDFLGVNYYFPSVIAAAPYKEPHPARRTADDIGAEAVIAKGSELTAMGWPVESDGLVRLLVWLRTTYPTVPPIYITENGRASDDAVSTDGEVHDPERIRYVDEHIGAVMQAVDAGVDVRRYYYWSLLDNFEWAEGYSKRFGLVYVDYPTQRRIPKASYVWFRERIQSGAAANAGIT